MSNAITDVPLMSTGSEDKDKSNAGAGGASSTVQAAASRRRSTESNDSARQAARSMLPPGLQMNSIDSAVVDQNDTAHPESDTASHAQVLRPRTGSSAASGGPTPFEKQQFLSAARIGPHNEPQGTKTAEVTSNPNPLETAKKLAAYAAVDEHVKPIHRVIGIGSGSTVPYVVERLCQEPHASMNEDRWYIPTGFQSKELIVKAGLKLGDVDQFPNIDVTIDGADEVDDDLNCIKGGGACQLREKVLAEAAANFIIIADYRKDSKVLGTTWKQGVPIEVAPFAWAKVFQNLQRMGCSKPVLRMGKMKAGPIVTDNGNFVIDANFDEAYMRDPAELLHRIKMLTGVLEVGIFAGMALAAYFGYPDGTVFVRWHDGRRHQVELPSMPA